MNWRSSVDSCWGSFGGQLCTVNQFRIYCKTTNLSISTDYWLGDRTDDDDAVHTNQNDCDNFDGISNNGDTKDGYYCCLEWMKY